MTIEELADHQPSVGLEPPSSRGPTKIETAQHGGSVGNEPVALCHRRSIADPEFGRTAERRSPVIG
jgi:hypothetical protein